MIKNLSISNFKLFKEINIPLNKLNLLTGINGKGKSTALQVFALMSQSVQKNRGTTKLYLHGANVQLGNLDDVKNRETSYSRPLRFTFQYDDFDIQYISYDNDEGSSTLNLSEIIVGSVDESFRATLHQRKELFVVYSATHAEMNRELAFPLFDLFLDNSAIEHYFSETLFRNVREQLNIDRIHYVSADRIGPRNYYDNKSAEHFVSVGACGENTVNTLFHKSTKPEKVNDIIKRGYGRLFHEADDELSSTVEENTNYWVGKIFQGAKVKVESISGEDLLKLRISVDSNGAAYYKPTNVGYGFSYSLPIIVSGLIAKPGEILIVENPEAHLHPYAQAIMAKFLALVASSGVQVFVESHSDHVLNGMRIAVKDEIIDSSELNVLYFNKRQNEMFQKIEVDPDGGISDWPEDFFDQSTNDLNYLLGI